MVKKEEDGVEVLKLTKPGQKYPTPTPGVAERVFYETLFEQNPNSAMAQEWCVAYGILEDDEAAKVLKVINARKAGGGKAAIYSPSPVKAAPKKKASASAASSKKGKKVKLDDDIPVDTGLAEAGDEGVGSMSFS